VGLTTSRIEIPVGAARMPAFVAKPAVAGARSAVILLMEAYGLVANFEREVERIARMGYVAVAPDLYHRQAPDNRAHYADLKKAIALMQRLSDEEFLADMRATIAHLRASPDVGARPIGVAGFCMGGRLAFLAACELPELRAAAPFYGGGIGALLERADKIACPLHLFFGQLDYFIPQEEVHRIEERLRVLGKTFALENYAGAVHGFCCEERAESYHPRAARDAWAKLEAFLARNLAG
jgi:carboxymethylenebutenolidase